MSARLILGGVCIGLLIFANSGLLALLWKRRNRFGRFYRSFVWFIIVLVVAAALMEVLLPKNSDFRLLIIPLFVFGGWYIFYDAYLKDHEEE